MGTRSNSEFLNEEVNEVRISEVENIPITQEKLIRFLENPIDLQEFKKKKTRYVTTTVTNGKNYHFQPGINNSIFYSYNFIVENSSPLRINEVIVFKYGENKHTFSDKSEILIELKVLYIDADLGKANLVGLTQAALEKEFGSDYMILDDRIVFSNSNKILILQLENAKVKSYRYISLSSEKIDSDLIKQLIE